VKILNANVNDLQAPEKREDRAHVLKYVGFWASGYSSVLPCMNYVFNILEKNKGSKGATDNILRLLE
jgi:hypothetical protein